MSRIRALMIRRSAAVASAFSLLLYGQIILAPPVHADPFSGGLSPTVFGAAADLNGDDAVTGRDDSNAFYGDTAIIDGKLDCNAWGLTANAGTAGDGTITIADGCTLVGYDGSADGVTITVANGSFVLADASPIADGTALPTVFNAADPDNPSVAAADFAWSTIGGRVDANGDEAIDSDDCTLGLIGETVDAGLGSPLDGADVLSTNASGVSPCEGAIGPAAADDGLVDLNSDKNITVAGDTCNNGCFLGHNVKEGVVQTTASPATVVPTSTPFGGGLSPTIFGAAADLNGDDAVSGRDDSNAFYGDTAIIDGKLDCNAWPAENDGTAGDGTITIADDCTLIGYDGSLDGVTITVANGLFVLADGAPIADGTALPTVFNAADPDNPSVALADFAWSTIGGRVDANGDEAIGTDDCTLGLIGETVDAGLGSPHDGADVLSTNASGVSPCEGLIGPAAADDGLVDVDSDRNITSGDSCTDGCFLGHDVLEGVVQAVPAISIGDVTAGEAAGTASFTVSLSSPTQSTVTVNYATADGTATAGSDYTTASGTVTFVASDTSETVSVPILNDTTDEPDETFVVNLSSPSNATIADAQGQGTIQDNDATPTVSIDDVSVGEGAGSATFTVSLSNPSSAAVTVEFDTADGTATAGSDYTAASGTVTFPAGDISEPVNVTILNDVAVEGSETFVVDLSNPSGATLGDAQGQGTILDNDSSISISDVTVSEAAGTANFTVSLSPSSSSTVTVDYVSANGTATAGSDYTTASGTVTFTPGDTSETVSVTILNDSTDEADETFFVNLSNAGNATIGDAQGLGTIQDNDATPAITIDNVTVGEAAGSAVFTVSLSNPSSQTVAVDYATADGSATAGSDYTATSGTVAFTAGDTTETVSVAILNDVAVENNETFVVDLSDPLNATIADPQGQGTIQDNDASISIGDVTVNEGAGTATFTVSLSPAAQHTVTVEYATADGTAVAGSDYTASSGTVTFVASDTSETVSVPILNDTLDEADETFKVDLSNASGATIADAQGQGTIQDNDAAPSISIDDVSVAEDVGTASFTVSLSATSGQAVTVDYATANGTATAGSDYTAASGTVTFTAGDTSEPVTVPILNDTADEPDETFVVDLSNQSNATISDAQGQGTIQDNDGTPTISIDDVSVNEGAGPASFTVSLSNPSSQTVTVNYATANGTATAGSDYTAASGTVTFTAGDTSEPVSVTILNDTTDEPDEAFVVNLSTPSNATIADAQGQGTIQDNDAEPSISINNVTVGEAAGTAGFTVSLSAASGKTVTVNYATANGTATAGSDYTTASGTVTFTAGDTSEPVSVTILNDTSDEPDETFVVNLSTPSNATIADAQGQGTIQDNDVTQTFDDVPPGHFAFEFVEKLVDAGITAGCSTNPPLYCPNSPVTRGQMAVFIIRAMGEQGNLEPYQGTFSDVPSSNIYALYIERLYDLGITGGCGTSPPRYCPNDPVTRGQMAVFILRGIGHGSAGHLPAYRGIFSDVQSSNPFARYIEHLYDHGVTAGCGTNPLRYCPGSAVTRAEMAVFIVKAFGL